MHKALEGPVITCYLCGKTWDSDPTKAPPFSVLGDRAVCDDHLGDTKAHTVPTWNEIYHHLEFMVALKKRHRRLSYLELDILALMQDAPLKAWLYPHLRADSRQAVDRLIARRLLIRLPSGDIRAA